MNKKYIKTITTQPKLEISRKLDFPHIAKWQYSKWQYSFTHWQHDNSIKIEGGENKIEELGNNWNTPPETAKYKKRLSKDLGDEIYNFDDIRNHIVVNDDTTETRVRSEEIINIEFYTYEILVTKTGEQIICNVKSPTKEQLQDLYNNNEFVKQQINKVINTNQKIKHKN